MRRLVARAALALLLLAPAPARADDPVYVLVRAGTLIDGSGAAPRRGVDVLVKDGKIAEVGAQLPAPSGATVIDLSGYTVLPGFIDSHVHLTTGPDGPGEITRTVTEGPADEAIRGVRHAQETIEAGFTTVRNVGAAEFVDVALKKAIDRGDVVGPRMITATNGLSIVGGHGDVNFLQPGILEDALDYTKGLPTGPDECRKAVRYAYKHGAGVIKVMSTGGVLSAGTTLAARQFSDEELRAIVEEASLLGLKVCCHAHGAAGIKAAVRAGVTSIEHGTFLDDEGIRLMKEHGTWLVPTRSAGEWVYARAQNGGLPHYTVAKALEVGPVMRSSFRKAYRAGVKIAFGTDAGVFPHGDNAKEFALMTALGMKPMEAIVSATSAASELLGWDEVGRIAPGRFGDFVVVEGDPLADIRVLEHPVAVLKGGGFVMDGRTRGSVPQAGAAAGR